MNLKDKIVVITGASRGLGKELALNFVKNDAKVVMVSKDKRELKKVADEIGGYPIACDVTDIQQVQELTKKVVNQFGRIDIWINDAGLWLPKATIEEIDTDRISELFEVNVFGLIYGSKQAFIQMKKQKNGTIINILSTIALVANDMEAVYCASKWAVNGFTQSLRMGAIPHNIEVLSVFPGGMKTNFFDEAKPEAYGDFMEPASVASKIIDNIKLDKPEEELIIRRPKK